MLRISDRQGLAVRQASDLCQASTSKCSPSEEDEEEDDEKDDEGAVAEVASGSCIQWEAVDELGPVLSDASDITDPGSISSQSLGTSLCTHKVNQVKH